MKPTFVAGESCIKGIQCNATIRHCSFDFAHKMREMSNVMFIANIKLSQLNVESNLMFALVLLF